MALMQGERALWQAVLERAALDLRGEKLHGEDATSTRQAALEWLHTDDFDEVCWLAGLDTTTVRKGMLNLGA